MAETKKKTTSASKSTSKSTTSKTKTTTSKPKEVKKPEMKAETKVKIFNNTSGKVYFGDAKGRVKRLFPNGFLVVNFEDLRMMMDVGSKLLIDGKVYVGDKYAREELGLDYDNVIQLRNGKEIIVDSSLEELEELFEDLDPDMIRELGEIAFEIRGGLPLNKLRLIEKRSKISLIDVIE